MVPSVGAVIMPRYTLLELLRGPAVTPNWAIGGKKPRTLDCRDWLEQSAVQGPGGKPPAASATGVAKLTPGRQRCLPCAHRAHRAAGRGPRSLHGCSPL